MIGDNYSFAPSVLLVTEAASAIADHSGIVRAAGARLRGAVPLGESIAWLDANAPVDAVLIDLDADGGDLLDAVLARLDQDVGQERHRAVIALVPALIDPVMARTIQPGTMLLVEPSTTEIASALVEAVAPRIGTPTLHERDGDPVRLRQLSEEVGRIARTLAELSDVGEARPPNRVPARIDAGDEPAAELSAAVLRSVIRSRRLRDQFFDARLFADPAWDMLLDLAAARLEGRRVAVSSLCIAAAVPATTALRWIRTLVEEGLFVRVADPRDGRRVFIELSEAAVAGVGAYFQALARAGIAAA